MQSEKLLKLPVSAPAILTAAVEQNRGAQHRSFARQGGRPRQYNALHSSVLVTVAEEHCLTKFQDFCHFSTVYVALFVLCV